MREIQVIPIEGARGTSSLALRRQSILTSLCWVACALGLPFALGHLLAGNYIPTVMILVFLVSIVVDTWAIKKNRSVPIHWTVVVSLLVALIATVVYLEGRTAIVWAFPVVTSLIIVLPLRAALCFNGILVTSVVTITYFNPEISLQDSGRILIALLCTVYLAASLLKIARRLQMKLSEDAIRDPLTGLLNRRFLESYLKDALTLFHRHQIPSAIAMIDIDRFKRVNDELGHDAGDGVLRSIAALLASETRSVEALFRLGGEEFLLILKHVSEDQAESVAQQLCRKISAASVLPEREITVSIGLCHVRAAKDWDHWVKRADAALYRAKRQGRDQVVSDHRIFKPEQEDGGAPHSGDSPAAP